MMAWQGIIHRYRRLLPVSTTTPIITLHEGNTPLIPAPTISEIVGHGYEVFLKYEGANPSGSFKDRGMTMAVSKIVGDGAKAIVCASTGNTSASAAAYAARAGLRCIVLIPEGAIALGKLAQALFHGATVLAVKGNFDDALELVKAIAARYPIRLVNSINPFRIEGQKTGAFEVCDQLGDAPDFHAIPVGNAGNITAYWLGYQEYHRHRLSHRLPVMLGFQAAGAAPIVRGRPVPRPQTIATAIRIGNPASWAKAEAARDASRGLIESVTDREILTAYRWLSAREGIFAEPASAASVAGVMKLAKLGYFRKRRKQRRQRIVCVLTGHGLKDPDRAIQSVPHPTVVAAKLTAVVNALRLRG